MLPIDQVGEMLEMIAPEKKISFDKNYAEEVYRQYNESKSVDDTLVIEELTKAFAGKRILLIGPGKSIIDANEKINKLVSATDDLSQVAYIGDDINDLSCMIPVKEAGGVVGCPADAVERVKEISDFVALHNGGDGAVRDFIEWIIKE